MLDGVVGCRKVGFVTPHAHQAHSTLAIDDDGLRQLGNVKRSAQRTFGVEKVRIR